MTLENFEQEISDVMLGRGYDYFTNKHVDDLEEIEPGVWTAEVQGTEIYLVTVELEKNEIIDWACDCPYDGEICKHVVAVLYEIARTLKTSKKKPKKKTPDTKESNVEVILKKTSFEDLKKFLIHQFSYSGGLKNSFVAYFAEYLDEDVHNKYRIIVQNIYKAARGRDGFIDYHSAPHLSFPLSELTDKAHNLLENKNLPECIAICKVLIEEVPTFLQYMDDSDGGVGGVMNSVFELFQVIIEKAPPELKDELFEYFLEEYRKEKYHNIGFDYDILFLILNLISLKEQEDKFFKLIDSQIEVEKNKEYPEYRVVRLLRTKVEYLLENKRENEAWAIIESNKHYDEFLKRLIERSVNNKDYNSAIELCNEAIIRVDKDGHSWSSVPWKKILLDIHEKIKDVKNIRKFAEELFFHSRELDYYKKLKSTFDAEEWKNVSEKIIDKIKGKTQQGGLSDASLLADIFILESYKERLLKLLEINSTQIGFIDSYSKHLKDEYPEKIVQFYQSAVKTYAKDTGRECYYNTVKYLKNLKKVNGGEAKVKELIAAFRIQYKNRRAMMEILNKNFS